MSFLRPREDSREEATPNRPPRNPLLDFACSVLGPNHTATRALANGLQGSSGQSMPEWPRIAAELMRISSSTPTAWGRTEDPSPDTAANGTFTSESWPSDSLYAIFRSISDTAARVAVDYMNRQDADNAATGASRAPPLTKFQLNRLPVTVLETTPGSDDAADPCPICHDAFHIGDGVVNLPCNHRYHEPCLQQWLGITGTCPLCRKTIADLTTADKRLAPDVSLAGAFGALSGDPQMATDLPPVAGPSVRIGNIPTDMADTSMPATSIGGPFAQLGDLFGLLSPAFDAMRQTPLSQSGQVDAVTQILQGLGLDGPSARPHANPTTDNSSQRRSPDSPDMTGIVMEDVD